MRPVKKENKIQEFRPYGTAQEPLVNNIGPYCSYCERYIPQGIHVEHKKPKKQYPELEFQWNNFLLACGNCNSVKGDGLIDLDEYVWPDTDNTLRAFKYEKEGMISPATGLGVDLDIKIKNTWKLVGLNRHPDTSKPDIEKPAMKDDRWLHRKQEWELALNNKIHLKNNDSATARKFLLQRATSKGMFSIWFTVFDDDIEFKKQLIQEYKNTAQECFDVNVNPIPRANGKI